MQIPRWLRTAVLIVNLCISPEIIWAQQVGECVKLKATSQLGVPLHASAGDHVTSGRLNDATIAKVDQIDQPSNWIHVTCDSGSGWIVRQYVGPVVPCEPAAATPTTTTSTSYVVGCWNIEPFDGTSARGFPENTNGGPSYPPHSQQDYETLA